MLLAATCLFGLEKQLGEEIPVVTLEGGKDGVFDEKFAKSIALLGKIFDRDARATELIDFINSEKAEIEEIVKDVNPETAPSVYICGLGNWGTANHLTSSSGYAPFKIANINNVTDSMSFNGNVTLEEEIFVSQGKFTDVIILDAAAVKNLKPLLADDPTLFDSYKAWQNGEVYLEMAYNAYYTNYEIALINTWFVAKCVYPDLFGDLDMTEKTNEITEKFLGKALAEEIFACPSSFGGYQKIDVATFFK
jgi:iron complex transport system substrate-binding protein